MLNIALAPITELLEPIVIKPQTRIPGCCIIGTCRIGLPGEVKGACTVLKPPVVLAYPGKEAPTATFSLSPGSVSKSVKLPMAVLKKTTGLFCAALLEPIASKAIWRLIRV